MDALLTALIQSPISAAIGPWVIVGLIAAQAIRKWMFDSGEAGTARRASDRERLSADQDLMFARLSAEVDRKEAVLVSMRRELGEIEDDRDRGWDLARAWRAWARDARHARINDRMIVTSANLLANAPPPIWTEPVPPVPALEEIEGRRDD